MIIGTTCRTMIAERVCFRTFFTFDKCPSVVVVIVVVVVVVVVVIVIVVVVVIVIVVAAVASSFAVAMSVTRAFNFANSAMMAFSAPLAVRAFEDVVFVDPCWFSVRFLCSRSRSTNNLICADKSSSVMSSSSRLLSRKL